MSVTDISPESSKLLKKLSKEEILNDYKIGWISRHVSILGRKEVLRGKAKFGIFGAGKEVPQLVAARFFENGDFRSGYYRDQTFMLAAGLVNAKQLFAQLYSDDRIEKDPHSGGRQMNAHFATKSVDENGDWLDLVSKKNSSSDVSCTSAQMARAVGLALASKKYRTVKELKHSKGFSDNGNEICFTTIGDASTSEGLFFEAINAAGVMQIPMAVFVWDDGYGISVSKEYQTTKGNISDALAGFQREKGTNGLEIYKAKAWQYSEMYELFSKAIPKIRKEHVPALFHIDECTQPQGHSTSGSHERYKSKERLAWEQKFDCLKQMRHWLLAADIADEIELDAIESEALEIVKKAKNEAWAEANEPGKELFNNLKVLIEELKGFAPDIAEKYQKEIKKVSTFSQRILTNGFNDLLFDLRGFERNKTINKIIDFKRKNDDKNKDFYQKLLFNESKYSVNNQKVIPAVYSENSESIPGYQILNNFFRISFEKNNKLLAFGEDVGKIGDVNQGFAGLQDIFGEERIFDTGIREATIMGQAIGLALRGLRPIAEIQYLDYFIWGLQPLTDDVASLHYRTFGQQTCPIIIRTRGHRLEGVWHTGSPMGLLINSLRGIHVCVPRNMVQAAGMYNTIFQSEDPAVVVESLNGYRIREQQPDNLGEYTVPLGVPEVIKTGSDVTIVTYGSCVRIAEETCEKLKEVNINAELIDVQTLLPFDKNHIIKKSLEKTNKLVLMDEDVPSGATAFMLQKIMEEQEGMQYLDAMPLTITSAENRTPFGSDGDFFCKPNMNDLFEGVYELMHEYQPEKYPLFYR